MSNYPSCLRRLVAAITSGTQFQDLDGQLIQEVNSVAQHVYTDDGICTPVHPMTLQTNQLVAFIYMNPDENTPFRIGIVGDWKTTGWLVYTLNIRKQREQGPKGGRGKVVVCGPGFRTYKVEHMHDVKIITGRRIVRRKTDEVARAILRLLGKNTPTGG